MREKLHSLKKARIRQSWNKYNLYNLAHQKRFSIEGKTYFQQKYGAKQETRRYHGEHLTKRAWQNIFKHTLHSVVPLNARVLAGNDGSEQALGRGSGLDPGVEIGGGVLGLVAQSQGGRNVSLKVPYMNQMWAPMERRLDMAIFRAMFASSARQARQFVVHGFAKVNGKKMKHPSYMLNPGDMFSVDPDRVLFATGAPKTTSRTIKRPIGESSEDPDAEAETSTEPSSPETPTSTTLETTATQPAEEALKEKTWYKDDPTNPLDSTKPYLTPWRPRDYLSPFAFIPRYLEVNFNICHAVYLRHPVARPGATEVASPFGPEAQQLAFHWFLRRR